MFDPLGGTRTSPVRDPRRLALAVLAVAGAFAIAACGADRQDADAEEGEFPVEVAVELPEVQHASEATDLLMGIENVGDETLPDVAVSLFVDEEAGDAFSIRVDDPRLADQDRPVWILAEAYPRAVGVTQETLTSTPFSHIRERVPQLTGATSAEANTFTFGALEPGELIEIAGNRTPVRAGGFVLNYEVAAGLQGPAEAVT
ncbi:MAG: hypothetical protein ACR2N5_03930, partial [Solirubrobacterales bacterium]